MIDDVWDQAEAEYLEQINLATGEPTVRLPGLFTEKQSKQEATEECVCSETSGRNCPVHQSGRQERKCT
jgi:hypothetical protein